MSFRVVRFFSNLRRERILCETRYIFSGNISRDAQDVLKRGFVMFRHISRIYVVPIAKKNKKKREKKKEKKQTINNVTYGKRAVQIDPFSEFGCCVHDDRRVHFLDPLARVRFWIRDTHSLSLALRTATSLFLSQFCSLISFFFLSLPREIVLLFETYWRNSSGFTSYA